MAKRYLYQRQLEERELEIEQGRVVKFRKFKKIFLTHFKIGNIFFENKKNDKKKLRLKISI